MPETYILIAVVAVTLLSQSLLRYVAKKLRSVVKRSPVPMTAREASVIGLSPKVEMTLKEALKAGVNPVVYASPNRAQRAVLKHIRR